MSSSADTVDLNSMYPYENNPVGNTQDSEIASSMHPNHIFSLSVKSVVDRGSASYWWDGRQLTCVTALWRAEFKPVVFSALHFHEEMLSSCDQADQLWHGLVGSSSYWLQKSPQKELFEAAQ